MICPDFIAHYIVVYDMQHTNGSEMSYGGKEAVPECFYTVPVPCWCSVKMSISWMNWVNSALTGTSRSCCLRLFQTGAKGPVRLRQPIFHFPNGRTFSRTQQWLLPSLTDRPSVLIFWTWTENPAGWDLPCKVGHDWVAQIFVSVVAHFFIDIFTFEPLA